MPCILEELHPVLIATHTHGIVFLLIIHIGWMIRLLIGKMAVMY